jgi:hypothetical protein
MLFLEWTPRPSHTAILVPKDTELKPGFRSYFLFDEEQKVFITNQGNMQGLDQLAVYSDTLFIDIDNNRNCMKKGREFLTKQGIQYQLYVSGGKGYHFVIPLQETYQHISLPMIHRLWVEQLDIDADLSIYRHAGLFRLPGTIHQSTRRKKRLLEARKGDNLSLDIGIELPKPKRVITHDYTSEEDALRQTVFAMINEPGCGGRYLTFWKLAKGLEEAGFSQEFSYELLQAVNNNWANPKELTEIERALRGVYNNG